jgi:hypothetical protein
MPEQDAQAGGNVSKSFSAGFDSPRRLGVLVGFGLAVMPIWLAAQQQPNFQGTWSGVFTTQDHEFWNVEDFTCFAGCPPEAYEFLTKLIDDPANAEKPLEELTGQARGFMRAQLAAKLTPEGLGMQNAGTAANDPTISCHSYGFAREATNPLPLQIRGEGGNLVIQYEEWNLSRTVYMDGRQHPKILTPTPLGHSIGRYEGNALVIDTVGIEADIFYSFLSGGGYGNEARGTERYTIAENPRRLNLELTIEDPVMLREPYVMAKTWLFTPDLQLVEDSCEDLPAQP